MRGGTGSLRTGPSTQLVGASAEQPASAAGAWLSRPPPSHATHAALAPAAGSGARASELELHAASVNGKRHAVHRERVIGSSRDGVGGPWNRTAPACRTVHDARHSPDATR